MTLKASNAHNNEVWLKVSNAHNNEVRLIKKKKKTS